MHNSGCIRIAEALASSLETLDQELLIRTMWMHDIYIGSNFSTFIEWKWKASLAPADCRNPEVVEGCGAAIALLVRDPMAALVFKSLQFSIGMWFRLGFVQVLHYL